MQKEWTFSFTVNYCNWKSDTFDDMPELFHDVLPNVSVQFLHWSEQLQYFELVFLIVIETLKPSVYLNLLKLNFVQKKFVFAFSSL